MSFFRRFYLLPRHLSKIEKIVILVLFGIILVSISLLLFDRFFVKKIIVPDFGGTYLEGGTGEVRCLIPIFKQTDIEKDISRLIFSSLIKYNGKREIVGDLAEKWEISKDGKTYTFYLREAKWQDGGRVTAEDVLFTFSLIQNEQTKSPFLESFREVKIQKIDDKTVSFVLKTPLAPFLVSFSVPILPKHLLSEIPSSGLCGSQFAKKPIGSGPFQLEKIEKNKEMTSVILESNKDYYPNRPYISKFVFKIYPSQGEAEQTLVKKQILGLFEGKKSLGKSYKVILPQYKAVFFNLNNPLDKDFRRALALFTNKEEIIKTIGNAEKVYFPILPGFWGYKESEKWDYNLELGKKFLAKSKSPKEVTFLISQSEDNLKIAEILKKQWENSGIKVNIIPQANTFFEKAVSDRNYDLLLAGVNQKADPDPYPFWHSAFADEGLNFSSLKNKEVDKLLEEARLTMDQNFRKQKYERFVDLIQNEVPAIFLYQPIYDYQISSIIKGLEDIQGVTKCDRFWNIENWYIKSKRVKSKSIE